MSAKPRDLLKTRRQRIGEVYMALHRNDGAFDVQLVSFGGDLTVNGGDATKFDISAAEVVLHSGIVNLAAHAAVALPAGADTDAATFRKVLIESAADGTLTLTPGVGAAGSQAAAVKPAASIDRIELGWIEVPPSFTHNVTNVTLAMLVKTPYWGSN